MKGTPSRAALTLLATLIGLAAMAVTGPAAPARAESARTDAEKRAIVYEMYADYRKKFPAVADISPKRAMTLMKTAGVVFVDTRTPEEMAVSMLPGAIPEKTFLDHPAAYRDHIVIAYCTISYRSGKFAEAMAERGVRVSNLTGGLLAWVLEGGKVYDDAGETRRIHVYGKKWNYPPAGYTSVMFSPLERLF
jgi:sodium/bile acid cotransporter 7